MAKKVSEELAIIETKQERLMQDFETLKAHVESSTQEVNAKLDKLINLFNKVDKEQEIQKLKIETIIKTLFPLVGIILSAFLYKVMELVYK